MMKQRKQTVVILGGAGFIGTHLAQRLESQGYGVRILTRQREHAKHLSLLPGVNIIECNIRDDAALQAALVGADMVINLVGILHESSKITFKSMHAELPQHLVKACQQVGTQRLSHVSALNADATAPSAYLRSKAEGESAIRHSNLDWTIFQPSVVFGQGDSFLTLFATLTQLMPVLFLASPNARFQPIWVEDLVGCIVNTLNNRQAYQQSFPLCGPHVYTLKQLVTLAGLYAGAQPRIIGLNPALSWLQASLMELLPIKLMTRDNLRSMEVDSVSDAPFSATLGITPTPLEAIAPDYLGGQSTRASYTHFRSVAGR